MYNIILVSGVQQSDSDKKHEKIYIFIYVYRYSFHISCIIMENMKKNIYIYVFFFIFSHFGLLQDVKYTVGPCYFYHFIYISLYLLISNS